MSILEQLEGQVDEGSDLTVTLDAEAQQIAQDGIENALSIPGTGSLVAIEPIAGAVRAMVSGRVRPEPRSDDFKELPTRTMNDPLVNRRSPIGLSAGLDDEVVTATAALDSKAEFEPSTTLNADSGIDISGVPLAGAPAGETSGRSTCPTR